MQFVAYAEEEIQQERLEAAKNKIAWKERSVLISQVLKFLF